MDQRFFTALNTGVYIKNTGVTYRFPAIFRRKAKRGWTPVFFLPVYLDAKRQFKQGVRRIA